MPRIRPDSTLTYSLLSEITSKNGHTYDKHPHLYAWYQFDVNMAAGADLPDLAIGSPNYPKDLESVSASDRPQAPTTDAPAGPRAPAGFATRSAEFSNDLIRHTTVSNFRFTDGSSDSPFSISVWFKETTRASHTNALLVSKLDGVNEFEWWLNLDNGRPHFRLYDDTSSNYIQALSLKDGVSTRVPTGEWTHLVATYDGSGSEDGLNLYMNGKLIDSENTEAGTYVAMHAETTSFALGNSYPEQGIFDFAGSYSEVAVWSTNLSLEDAKALYEAKDLLATRTSGFLNLPPRIEIRSRDNATGSYPTILRMGDKDRKGSYSTQFNDNHTIDFGRRIEDNFELLEKDKFGGVLHFGNNINRSKWVTSQDMTIRTELYSVIDKRSIIDSALIFAGDGPAEDNSSAARFIRTRDKIKNAEVNIDFVVGPYDQRRTALGAGLGLKFPKDSLSIQVNTGSTGAWTTIKTLEGSPDQLFGQSTDVLRSEFDRKFNSRHRVSVKLSRKDFDKAPWSGTGTAFYLRIAQTNISQRNDAYWGIDKLKIDYYSGNKNYPLLIRTDNFAGRKVLTGAIATPHKPPTIFAEGRSVSGISDTHMKFTPGENISPFDDARIQLDPDEEFFRVGTKNEHLPGFDSSLFSKTQFVIDLSPHEEVPFGMISGSTSERPGEESDTKVKQPLMVYWNNNDKQWNHVAQGISSNAPTGSLVDMITSGALGFGTHDLIADGNGAANVELLSPHILNTYVRPTSTFGFPFEGKYHGNENQVIRASDIGITKPFLLEKCQVTFECKFGFGQDAGADDALHSEDVGDRSEFAYAIKYGTNPADSTRVLDERQRVYIPTFFLLRQKPFDKFDFNLNYKIDQGGAFVNLGRTIRTGDIYNLSNNETGNSDSAGHAATRLAVSSSVPVNSSREMITYGQITLFTSSSTGGAQQFVDLRGALESGLSRDAEVDILAQNGQNSAFSTSDTITPLTGSFTINFPCRTTGKIELGSRLRVTEGVSGSSSNFNTGLWLNNVLGGRSYGNMNSNARALVGGVPAYTPTIQYTPFRSGNGSRLPAGTAPNIESMDIISPYIIYPEDELLIGWQYPTPYHPRAYAPGKHAKIFNDMTLFGRSRLTLFGSQVRDGKEIHETVNQNLTSDSVHEIIGSESVVDRFEISLPIDSKGNTYDNYVATIATDPVNRINSRVESRITTAKGISGNPIGRIKFPLIGIRFGSGLRRDPGFNDGDVIRLQDAKGNVAYFYMFKHHPWGPRDNALITSAAPQQVANTPNRININNAAPMSASVARDAGKFVNWTDSSHSTDEQQFQLLHSSNGARTQATFDLSASGAAIIRGIAFISSSAASVPIHYPVSGTHRGYAQVNPGDGAGGTSTEVFSVNIDGPTAGDYSSSDTSTILYSETQRMNTLRRLAAAIDASLLRMIPFVAESTFTGGEAALDLTQLDGGASGNTKVEVFKANTLFAGGTFTRPGDTPGDSGNTIDYAGIGARSNVTASLENRYFMQTEHFEGGVDGLIDGSKGSFVGTNNLFDSVRVYADSRRDNPLLDSDSAVTYGSWQSQGGIRPRYYADPRKFGQFRHLLEQGKDSKMVSQPLVNAAQFTNKVTGDALQSVAKVTFVSGSVRNQGHVDGAIGVKYYYRHPPSSSGNQTTDSSTTTAFVDPTLNFTASITGNGGGGN